MRFASFCVLAALLTGCASYSGYGLTPGVSTAEEVVQVMGQPARRTAGPGEETLLWYPRLPYGRQSFAARIAPDGKLVAIEERLTDQNIARLRPNEMRMQDVLSIVGPPYRSTPFPRMDREIWDYPTPCLMTCRLLVVQFSPDGVLREVYHIQDPEALPRDGGGRFF